MANEQNKLFEKAATISDDLIEDLGYTDPPISSLDIASYLGYSVEEIQMPENFIQVAGYIVEKEKKIVLNKEDPLKYKVYTVAQQLGISLLNDIQLRPEQQNLALNRGHDFGSETTMPLVKSAHYFALNLLVPDKILRQYRNLDPATLSKLFIVPQRAINLRLQELA